ncbi:transcriptional regulator Rfx1p [[Candida] anglica]|uniref:Transcriptional regulator Rfx1p n=1 Tax=[Candida] anglica TaxID=148631 RepID=A0ABP0EHP5_9ASCO
MDQDHFSPKKKVPQSEEDQPQQPQYEFQYGYEYGQGQQVPQGSPSGDVESPQQQQRPGQLSNYQTVHRGNLVQQTQPIAPQHQPLLSSFPLVELGQTSPQEGTSASYNQTRHIQNYNQQVQLKFEMQRQYQQQQQQQQQQQMSQLHLIPAETAPPYFIPQKSPIKKNSNASSPQEIPSRVHTPENSIYPDHTPVTSARKRARTETGPLESIPTQLGNAQQAYQFHHQQLSQLQQGGQFYQGTTIATGTEMPPIGPELPDIELKQLAFKASQKPLTDLALKIKAMENEDIQVDTKALAGVHSSNKERERQIFAMVWLLGACDASPTAVVPRTRIYARYVQICADYSLKPLSSASIGKFVRILFPNLTTRRLGMRGQSKYHYCGIKLVGETGSGSSGRGGTRSGGGAGSASGAPGGGHSTNNSGYSSAASPSPASSYGADSPSVQQPNTPLGGRSPGISRPSTPGPGPLVSLTGAVGHISGVGTGVGIEGTFGGYLSSSSSTTGNNPLIIPLAYTPNLLPYINSSLSTQLNLPPIYPYLPPNSDYDIADTLYSLYRVHCTTIFDSLRFMQTKKLFSAFSNFTAILTAPILKLYVSAFVLEWIQKCDSVMYRGMTKMLTKLHLQSVPEDVLQRLKEIAAQYVENLSQSLQKVPKHFLAMKLQGAQQFVKVLNRLIRVVETGQFAARILNNSVEKQAMLNDWMKLDIRQIVLREVSCSLENIDILLDILTGDFLRLFDSSEGMIHANAAAFLADLPGRFSRINSRMFILVTSNFLTTCLREISLSGGQGFGAWWIVRCWVDEYLKWYFELGGMLQEEFTRDGKDSERETAKTEPTEDEISKSNMVDLLDGFETKVDFEHGNSGDQLLEFDHVENILGRSGNILGLQQ